MRTAGRRSTAKPFATIRYGQKVAGAEYPANKKIYLGNQIKTRPLT